MSLREQTRDKLGGCDCGPGPMPGPAPTIPPSVFTEILWKTVYDSGFYGNKKEFLEVFVELLNTSGKVGMPGIISQFGSRADFPEFGIENAIYCDTNRKQLYMWQDKKGYIMVSGGSGSGGSVVPEDIYEMFDEKVVFSGGNAETAF